MKILGWRINLVLNQSYRCHWNSCKPNDVMPFNNFIFVNNFSSNNNEGISQLTRACTLARGTPIPILSVRSPR